MLYYSLYKMNCISVPLYLHSKMQVENLGILTVTFYNIDTCHSH